MLGGHLLMNLFSAICVLLVFFTLTVFVLVLMLKVQKECNDAVDTCISELFTYPNNLQTKGVQITENTLYMF